MRPIFVFTYFSQDLELKNKNFGHFDLLSHEKIEKNEKEKE